MTPQRPTSTAATPGGSPHSNPATKPSCSKRPLALPTLNKRVLKKLAAVDRDEPDLTVRTEQKRVIVLLSEIDANTKQRRRERE